MTSQTTRLSNREIRTMKDKAMRSDAFNRVIEANNLTLSELRLYKMYTCITTLALVISIVKSSLTG